MSEVFEGYALGDAVDAPAPLLGYLSEKNGVPGVLYVSNASDPAQFSALLPGYQELDLSGIVRILDGGVTGSGACWVVTERPGANLAAPEAGREGLLRVLDNALQLVCLLEVAHEHGRFHGDLGFDCLHLDEMEILQLSRLGFLALFSFGQESLAAAPRYRAPEVRRGDAVRPGADLYSLGAMLGEVAQAYGADVPVELRALVAAATAVDPAERYDDAASMFVALREVSDAVAVWVRARVERAPEPEVRDTLPAAEVRTIEPPRKAPFAVPFVPSPAPRGWGALAAIALVLSALSLGAVMGPPWGRRESGIVTTVPAAPAAVTASPPSVPVLDPNRPPPVPAPSGAPARRPLTQNTQIPISPVAGSSLAAPPASAGAAADDGEWYDKLL